MRKEEEQNENQVHTRGWVGVVVARHLHPCGLRTNMRFTRWGVEHGVLVLCTVATAGALGNMYYKKKNDIPYKVKLVKDPDGFNDVISYAVYHLYQFEEKHFPSDPDLPKGPTLAEKRVKRQEQLQSDLGLLRKKYGLPESSKSES